MNPHRHFLAETHFFGSFSSQESITLHSRGPRSIIHLAVVYMCAFRHYFAARGSLRVDRLSLSDQGRPRSDNLATTGIQYVEAKPPEQGDWTQSSAAPVLCRGHDKLQLHRILRRLQRESSALSTEYNKVGMSSTLDIGAVPPPIRPHPALDVTFLFATPKPGGAVHSPIAPAILSPPEEYSFATAFNSSQLFDLAESMATGGSRKSAVTTSLANGDLSVADELLSKRSGNHTPPDFSHSGRQSQPENEAEDHSFRAHMNDFRTTKNLPQSHSAENHSHPRVPSFKSIQEPLYFQSHTSGFSHSKRRSNTESEAKDHSLPAHMNDFRITKNLPQSQSAEIHSPPRVPSLENEQEPPYFQLQTRAHNNGLHSVVPQTDPGGHSLRRNSFDNLTQAGIVHWHMNSQALDTVDRRTLAPPKPSEFPVNIAQTEGASLRYTPLPNGTTPANASPGRQASPTTLRVPADATAGAFPALLGQLLPLISPFLRLQVLAGRLPNLQDASRQISTAQEMIPFVSHMVTPVSPDQGSILAPSPFSAILPNLGLFSASTNLAGIVPFLSEILTGLPVSRGVLNLVKSSGQKLPSQANADNISRDPENDATATMSPETGELPAGIGSGYQPAESALSAYAESGERVDETTLALPSTAVGAAPLWHVGYKPVSSGSPLSPDDDLVQPASTLRPPLPRPNRSGNMTALNFPPRPAQSIPLHALHTTHLRHTDNPDGDMADFFDSVIQRVWRTASGPSSFMRVPPPLYSHRAPEEVTEEIATTLERGIQLVQPEGQEEKERSVTFSPEEDVSLRASSAEDTRWNESDVSRSLTFLSGKDESLRADSPEKTRHNESGISRWSTRSQNFASGHAIPTGVPSGMTSSAIQKIVLPFEPDGRKRTAEAKLSVPEEQVFRFGLEDHGRSAGRYDLEVLEKWARRSFDGNDHAGSADRTDGENIDWSARAWSRQHSPTVGDGAVSTTPSPLISPNAGAAFPDAGDCGDSDLAAKIVHKLEQRNTSDSLLPRRPVGGVEENVERDAEFADGSRCGTGLLRSHVALAASQGRPLDRVKEELLPSVQQPEPSEKHFLPPFQLSVSRHDACADQRDDSGEHSKKVNVVSAGAGRPKTFTGDTIPSNPCLEYRCSVNANSDYSVKDLSLSFVPHDNTVNRISVRVNSHGGCTSHTCLTTENAEDQRREGRPTWFLDFETAANPEQQFKQFSGSHETGQGPTQPRARPCQGGNDYIVCSRNTPSAIQKTTSDVPEAPASKIVQLVNTQQTADSLAGIGKSKAEAAVTTKSSHELEESSFKSLSEGSPSESSSSTNLQPKLNYRARAPLLENPEGGGTSVGQDEDSVNTAQDSDKHEYQMPSLPQEQLLDDPNSPLIWFREAQSRREGRRDTLQQNDRSLLKGSASAAPLDNEHGSMEHSYAKQLDSVGAFSPTEDAVEFDHPWSGRDTEENFFLAFNGFPEPYDYYFPLHYTEEDPFQQPLDDAGAALQGKPPDEGGGDSPGKRHRDYHHSLFPAGDTAVSLDAPEIHKGATDGFSSSAVPPHGNTTFTEYKQYVFAGDEEGPDFAVLPPYPENEDFNSASGWSPSGESAPLLSRLSSFFQTLPLAEWLRLDPTRVGPFDWKKVFGNIIPMERRFKRAKEMAHDVILNEYCNRTASESSTENNPGATLGGFSFRQKVFHVPERIQSDFRKCVEFYRVRTREYVEEYRSQCQEVWEDPRSPIYGGRNFITVDDVADCLVQKYDVGRRWFNELFYQPWYRLMNQTSYLLQAVDTAFAEFHYDAWFFPAAYSAANFGLWRACSNVDDCFTGEVCVEALPRLYNFTLSFCHHTPESMNLDPITGMPLEQKFS